MRDLFHNQDGSPDFQGLWRVLTLRGQMNHQHENSMEENEMTNRTSQQRPNGRTELSSEQELVFRVKSAIDQKGRYDFRLNDMAAGYAAAQGVSHATARRDIEGHFTDQVGLSPHEYLERHFQEKNRDKRENSHSGRRERDQDRER
jgi:hypothetical protein